MCYKCGMDEIKDPLGVVAKWQEEAQPHHFTGWDDVKFGLGMPLLIVAFIGSVVVLIWSLLA